MITDMKKMRALSSLMLSDAKMAVWRRHFTPAKLAIARHLEDKLRLATILNQPSTIVSVIRGPVTSVRR